MTTTTVWKMEDDLIFLETARQPQFVGKWKKIPVFGKFKFLKNGR
jgi:hypothetical protein